MLGPVSPGSAVISSKQQQEKDNPQILEHVPIQSRQTDNTVKIMLRTLVKSGAIVMKPDADR